MSNIAESATLDMIADRIVHASGGPEKTTAEELQRVLELVTQRDGRLRPGYARDRMAKYASYRETLSALLEIPVIEQKSDEWYRVRQSIVTASDFAQALGEGKFGTQTDFYVKKAGYVEVPFDANCPPLKWGVMLEDVASAIYERRNACKVLPFGLIRHPHIEHFGASPDGITTLGVMLEIKCPYRRKITGEVPKQYYYQVQGQLDVCGLEECDYLECEFCTVSDPAELEGFSEPREIGCIIELNDSTEVGPGRYEYSPIFGSSDKGSPESGHAGLLAWIAAARERHAAAGTNVTFIYWYLDRLNVVRIYKDPDFVRRKMAELDGVWRKVLDYRSDRALYDREVAAPKHSSSSAPKRGGGGIKTSAAGVVTMSGYGFLDV